MGTSTGRIECWADEASADQHGRKEKETGRASSVAFESKAILTFFVYVWRHWCDILNQGLRMQERGKLKRIATNGAWEAPTNGQLVYHSVGRAWFLVKSILVESRGICCICVDSLMRMALSSRLNLLRVARICLSRVAPQPS